jgi:hypothetical protein
MTRHPCSSAALNILQLLWDRQTNSAGVFDDADTFIREIKEDDGGP